MPLLKPTRGTLLNTSHPLARGLVGCWLFNEGSGDKVYDLSGRRHTGAIQAGTTWAPGKFGWATDHDGSTGHIEIADHDDFTPALTPFSISAWIYMHDATQFMIASKGVYNTDAEWAFYTVNSDYLRFRVFDESVPNCYIGRRTSAITSYENQWIHLVATYDGGTLSSGIKLYLNSIQRDNANTQLNPGSFVAAENLARPVYLGRYAGMYADGLIDNVMFFNEELTQSEAALLYREPFCMFERALRPELIGGPIVNLVGTLTALSSLSATAKAIRKVGGTVVSKSNVAALLNSIRGEESSLEIERSWLREALFNGMTASAFKLGTTLSLGWFWVRVAGCSVLYRGPSMERIDFTNILTVAEQNACEISPPSYIPHNNSSIYFYVIRRFSNCGYQELTLTAAAKVSIDANGELENPQPSNIFSSKAEQVDGNKIQLVWFYCPLEQKSQPVCFNVYYDGGMGQIDYENPLAKISYEGRRFYSYQSGALGAGGYLFTIRAEDADGVENSSSAQLKIQLDTTNPDAIDILGTETV